MREERKHVSGYEWDRREHVGGYEWEMSESMLGTGEEKGHICHSGRIYKDDV